MRDGAPNPRPEDIPIQEGTRIRDAAVDPLPTDFLPPTNAGEADPHGPEVIAIEVDTAERNAAIDEWRAEHDLPNGPVA